MIYKLFPQERCGFILKEESREVYFHANALQELNFERLEDRIEVVFGLEQGKKDPQATVVALPPHRAQGALDTEREVQSPRLDARLSD